MDLSKLLTAVAGMSVEDVEKLGRKLYRELYLNQGIRGVHATHDGEKVLFWEDRFDHAFFTSSDRARHPLWKDKLAIERVERIRWIGELVAGRVPGFECWEVPGPGGRFADPNRLYVIWSLRYVAWLEPRNAGDWKFSSAYTAQIADVRRYCQLGRKLWPENKKPRD
jgi:hypothetical protein